MDLTKKVNIQIIFSRMPMKLFNCLQHPYILTNPSSFPLNTSDLPFTFIKFIKDSALTPNLNF